MSKTPEAPRTTEEPPKPLFNRFLRSTEPFRTNVRAGRACVANTDTCAAGGADTCGCA